MRNKILLSAAVLAAIGLTPCRGPVCAGEAAGQRAPTNSGAAAEKGGPAEKKLALSLHAGRHDRCEHFVSVLIDAGKARSVFVEYADGTLGRAQLADPGMLNAAWRDTGKKELHFASPKMAKGQTARVVAAISERPVEGRTYVWDGEPRQNRRVSCGQCHQGVSPPTGDELRQERKILEETGKPPPLNLPRILPTSKGRDFRWHEKSGRFQVSTCWECHARHMVQYEFGQSLERDLPWAPDPPHRGDATELPAVQSVFYTVFRVRGGRAVSHPLNTGKASPGQPSNWQIHYGFDRAMAGGRQCTGILQQHAGILSEEAGKFIGRHCVLIDWVGNIDGKKKRLAREERQVTVKDWRGRNKSYAMWIDFVSTLRPDAEALRLDGGGSRAGLCFIPTVDKGTAVEHRKSVRWRAITFVSEGTTYTAACFDHSGNPQPLAEGATDRAGDLGPAGPSLGVGYDFSAACDGRSPLLVHYRFWIQGGRMPAEEIQSLSDDFVEPVEIELK
jgi:hypothetical protein